MTLIAHRCGTDKYPELTLDAAKYSLMHGFSYVEMDIRFTKDDVPIISHDDNALRLFGSHVKISDLLLNDFIKLEYASDDRYHAITLEDVFDSSVAPILFHIKEGGNQLFKILDLIRQYKYEDKVIIGVSSSEDIRIIKEFNTNISVLGFMPSKSKSIEFMDNGADIIRLWEEWVDNITVELIKKSGKKVWIMAGSSGTVGYTNKENLIRWQSMKVDGVLINEIGNL